MGISTKAKKQRGNDVRILEFQKLNRRNFLKSFKVGSESGGLGNFGSGSSESSGDQYIEPNNNDYPIQKPINNLGEIGLLTQAVYLSDPDGHATKMTLVGDIGIGFENPPDDTKLMEFVLDITQDAVGGHAVDFGIQVLQPIPVIKTGINERTILRFQTTDGGVTYQVEDVTSSGGFGSAPPFIDSDPLIKGSGDPTKLLKFEVDGFPTAITRTITIPDSSTIMAGLGVLSQTWTGTNIFAGNISVKDNNFFIQNLSDITKQAKFDLAGATTGKVLTLKSNHTNNRTLTFPDTTTSLAGLGVLSQDWTGTNTFFGITNVKDDNYFIQNLSDPTKQVKWDLSNISISTTRTLVLPDSSTTLAGLGVLSQTWTGTNVFAGNMTVRDTNFFIQQTSDITKQAKFDLAGATTGKVLTIKSNHTDNRTLILPDTTTSLAGLGTLSQTWTGTNIFVGITNVRDSNFSLQNISDITKQVKFDVSSISTGTTRTLTIPNTTTTLAGLGVPDQSWTGTNTFFGITKIRTNNNFFLQDVTDLTKQVKWDLSAISTGTTRTITMPDADVLLGGSGSQTPWTSDIDAASFDLTNVGNITVNQNATFNGAITTIGNSQADFIQGLGTLSRDWLPSSSGVRVIGDSSHRWSAGTFDRINIGDAIGSIHSNVEGIEIRVDATNDSIELMTSGAATKIRIKDDEIQFFEPLDINDDVTIDGGHVLQSFDSQEIGLSVTNELTNPGTEGTLQPPRLSGNPGSDSAADTDFGAYIGAVGIINANSSFPQLIWRNSAGKWVGIPTVPVNVWP